MLRRLLMAPAHAAMLATGAQSFEHNGIIGSRRLNALGLHVGRIRLAERMADARRCRLGALVSSEDAAAYARDGIVVRPDALPADVFAQLRDAALGRPVPVREMRQGGAVTRLSEIGPRLVGAVPGLAEAVGPLMQGLLRYVAAADAEPLLYLHCVLTDADTARRDPQTLLHADTFHATAKAWLFLDDVAPEDGPFSYVPGSHRLTEGRIAWERAQSLIARDSPDGDHRRGSFRATAEAVAAMGYGPVVAYPVRANTLIVADTHGFHARARASRASVRPAIYGSLRRNPFLPWTGLDPFALPGLRGRKTELFGAWQEFAARRLGPGKGRRQLGEMLLTERPARRRRQAE